MWYRISPSVSVNCGRRRPVFLPIPKSGDWLTLSQLPPPCLRCRWPGGWPGRAPVATLGPASTYPPSCTCYAAAASLRHSLRAIPAFAQNTASSIFVSASDRSRDATDESVMSTARSFALSRMATYFSGWPGFGAW